MHGCHFLIFLDCDNHNMYAESFRGKRLKVQLGLVLRQNVSVSVCQTK